MNRILSNNVWTSLAKHVRETNVFFSLSMHSLKEAWGSNFISWYALVPVGHARRKTSRPSEIRGINDEHLHGTELQLLAAAGNQALCWALFSKSFGSGLVFQFQPSSRSRSTFEWQSSETRLRRARRLHRACRSTWISPNNACSPPTAEKAGSWRQNGAQLGIF